MEINLQRLAAELLVCSPVDFWRNWPIGGRHRLKAIQRPLVATPKKGYAAAPLDEVLHDQRCFLSILRMRNPSRSKT